MRILGATLLVTCACAGATLALAAIAPQGSSARMALTHAIASVAGTVDTARSQLAAAGTTEPGFLANVLCAIFHSGCPQEPITITQTEGNAARPVTVPLSYPAAPSATATTTPAAQRPPQPTIVQQITEPVIQRVVETQRVVTQGGVSETTLADKLNALENKLRSLIFAQSSQQSAQTPAVYQVVAQSQRIDNLSNTTISNPTITGGSITAASIAGTTVPPSRRSTISPRTRSPQPTPRSSMRPPPTRPRPTSSR